MTTSLNSNVISTQTEITEQASTLSTIIRKLKNQRKALLYIAFGLFVAGISFNIYGWRVLSFNIWQVGEISLIFSYCIATESWVSYENPYNPIPKILVMSAFLPQEVLALLHSSHFLYVSDGFLSGFFEPQFTNLLKQMVNSYGRHHALLVSYFMVSLAPLWLSVWTGYFVRKFILNPLKEAEEKLVVLSNQ